MGRVIFIGAGPGAADLITLRGARFLAKAQVVLFDALTDSALREFAPAAQWLDVGKRGFSHSTGQTAINALLIRHASASNLVVRLKGGDPSIFGRLEEEIEALVVAGIEFDVVPGVTAALAAAAATRRPLTRRGRGRSVSLSTAMTLEKQLHAGRTADTEVFYMAGRQLGGLARRLIAAGWPENTAVSVISRAGWTDELRSDHVLAQLGQASLLHSGRPSVVVVGAGAVPVASVNPSASSGAEAASNPARRVARTKP